MFVQTYSYDDAAVLVTKKRLRGYSLDISLPIDTKSSHIHAHPSSIQRSKGCDGFTRGRESLTIDTQDFDFSISNIGVKNSTKKRSDSGKNFEFNAQLSLCLSATDHKKSPLVYFALS